MATQIDRPVLFIGSDHAAIESAAPANVPLNPSIWDPDMFARDAASLGVRPARAEEVAPARALGVRETGCELAPLWSMLRAHWRCQPAIWVHRSATEAGAAGPINGVLMSLPLTKHGEQALLVDRFTFAAPDPAHICRPGDAISAMYMWLFAGSDGAGRRAVLRTALAWRDGAYADLRAYARAATAKGAAALAGLRFVQAFNDRPTLMFCDTRKGAD